MANFKRNTPSSSPHRGYLAGDALFKCKSISKRLFETKKVCWSIDTFLGIRSIQIFFFMAVEELKFSLEIVA
jgi:hypothetical protein